ncbi:TonB-dependent receptor [Neoasaia chiangmaiensis]|uniref:TonB-dependent receptor n=3 Tax=Neoasaia chiangmaiensis TaxID=320497 RepID=A0A1U9KUW9_9PROT|nr:TonB-dependent receptor [Neoasaia chiangmaiensis]
MSRGGLQRISSSKKSVARAAFRISLLGSISCICFTMVSADAQTQAVGTAPAAHHKKAKRHTHGRVMSSPAPVEHATVGAAASSTSPVKTAPATLPNVTSTTNRDLSAANTQVRDEQITVTGTRLSQSRLTNVMAGTTVDAEQLKERGYTNVGLALLREDPAFSVPSNSPIGNQGSYGAGQTFNGLLGLGSQRMLTLVNGRRYVGGASASIFGAASGSQVDSSTIPSSLVKKAEIKYGGAGAAYGADAVAGVTNYILDDDFEGVDLTAQGGMTQKLDGGQQKIAFKAGRHFDHDRGSAVFDLEYNGNSGLTYADRPNVLGGNATTYSQPQYGTVSPYAYTLQQARRYLQVTTSGIPMTSGFGLPDRYGRPSAGIAGANGNTLIFSPDGKSLIPQTYNYAFRDNRAGSGGNGPALANYNTLQTPQDRLNLTTLGKYEFNDHLRANWEAWYQRGSASSPTAQGYWSTALFDDPLTMDNFLNEGAVNGPYVLSTNNPYLTAAQRTTIINGLAAKGLPTDTFYMTRLNQDLDGGSFQTTNQMFRFAGGLTGDFNAVGRKFEWHVNGTYGKYMNSTTQPQVATQNLINAVNATTDAAGNIVCAPGYVTSSAPTRSRNCAPIDLFGTGQLTPAARDYVTADSVAKNSNAQRDFTAEINSTVVKLPAGDVRWDIGYEHRREGYNFNPGVFNRGELLEDGTYRRYGNSIPITPVAGAYHTHEAYGELDVPLISPDMHLPGAYNLSGTANGRYVNNSITGGYWTYMFGGAWWPTRDLGLSGNYAQSVRNPSVTELFAPQGSVYDSGSDPCSTQFIGSGPNPAIRAANCAKAGVPTNFSDSNINLQTVPGSSGGNARLQNETSKSFTGTLTFQPHFIRGFSLTSSFIDVKINNEIEDLGVADLMAACYDSASYPNQYCNAFTRDGATHQITNFQEGPYNIANQHVQALQSKIDYFLPLRRVGLPADAGSVEVAANYIHYVKNTTSYLGTTYQNTGATGSPNDSFTANFNYLRGPLHIQWQTIFYGPSKYALQVTDTTYDHLKRPSYAYFNTTIGYQFNRHFDANFIMNNVTNSLPKYPGTVSLTRYYDAIMGRSFLLELNAHL